MHVVLKCFKMDSFFHHRKALVNKTMLVAAWTAGRQFTTQSKQGGMRMEAHARKLAFESEKDNNNKSKPNIHGGGISH